MHAGISLQHAGVTAPQSVPSHSSSRRCTALYPVVQQHARAKILLETYQGNASCMSVQVPWGSAVHLAVMLVL